MTSNVKHRQVGSDSNMHDEWNNNYLSNVRALTRVIKELWSISSFKSPQMSAGKGHRFRPQKYQVRKCKVRTGKNCAYLCKSGSWPFYCLLCLKINTAVFRLILLYHITNSLHRHMWHDQGKWVTCRQCSILSFQYNLLVHLRSYILIQTPLQSEIWFQRYEQIFEFLNNVKH